MEIPSLKNYPIGTPNEVNTYNKGKVWHTILKLGVLERSQLFHSVSDPSSSDRTKQESHQSKTSEKSEEVLKEDSDTEDDLEKMNKDLLKNEELPDEAKSMLAELQMDPSGNNFFYY